MGKAKEIRIQSRSGNNKNSLLHPCDNLDAPICDNCCSPHHHQPPAVSTNVIVRTFEKNDSKEDNHKVIYHNKEQEQVAVGRLQLREPPLVQQQESERDDDIVVVDVVDDDDDDDDDTEEIKELVVIGAGPHAMALVLRLLCPEPDLMTEKERHYKMEHHDKKLRRIPEVKTYIRSLIRSINKPGQILKTKSKKKQQKQLYTKDYPPKIDLERFRKSVVIFDKSSKPITSNDEDVEVEVKAESSGWLLNWDTNFEAIQIPHLRSLSTAHLDPYDHRALDAYADVTHQATAHHLVPLQYLTQRDKEFHGPYDAPTTKLFHEFHNVLSKAYGIHDLVSSSSEVTTIILKSGLERFISEPQNTNNNPESEPYFEVHVRKTNVSITTETNEKNEDEKKNDDHTKSIISEQPVVRTIVKTKRVVCALGPMFQTGTEFWEQNLPQHCRHRIVHCHDIVPWLVSADRVMKSRKNASIPVSKQLSLLIVGGGIRHGRKHYVNDSM